ncbi:hypothetical protein ACFT1A_30555 [Rhodococcus sp. NPDC057135]|uniref:hypothetical protein n=1 Tax=Rhodococcus sp. NPDC057135 TaxID=3346028 RepID=UPI00363A4FD2
MISGRVLRLAGAAAAIGTVALVAASSRTTWDSWTPEWFTPGWWPLIILALVPYLAQTILCAAGVRQRFPQHLSPPRFTFFAFRQLTLFIRICLPLAGR